MPVPRDTDANESSGASRTGIRASSQQYNASSSPMPQAEAKTDTDLNFISVATRTGVVSPCPQQYSSPDSVTAQLRLRPAAMDLNRSVVCTRRGGRVSLAVPTPSCPDSFAPQQYARPSASSPH